MRLGVLFSGGKDSCYAMHLAMKEHKIKCLISLISENSESYMFHTPNIELVEKQAEAIGIPIVLQHTKGSKEKELNDLKTAIQNAVKDYKIEGIVTGAVKSVYQASRIQKICNELNLWCFNPLWLSDEFEYLSNLIKDGFEVIITGVFAYPLTEDFLGRKLDEVFYDKITALNKKFKISPVGEGGEFETFVCNAPFFKKRVKVIKVERTYSNYSGLLKIKKVVL